VLFSIGTMLFLGVVGMLIYSLVRFRRREGDLGDGAAIESLARNAIGKRRDVDTMAATAGGTGTGVGLAAASCSAVGKLSFMIAVTSVGLAAGEATGAGFWARRCAAGATNRRKTATRRALG
jgi:hypothetical protein